MAKRTREECESGGGTWDSETETCKMPEASKKSSLDTRRSLLERRNAIAGQLLAKLDTVDAEFKAGTRAAPEFTTEERANYDQMHADMTAIEAKITAIDARAADRRQLAEREAELRETPQGRPVAQRTEPGTGGAEQRTSPHATESYRAEWRNFLRTGFIGPEMRALQANSDIGGGFTIAPEQFDADLIKNVADEVIFRQIATVRTLEKGFSSIGWPTLTRMGAATWGTELQVATADSTMSFGKRRLAPNPLTAQILISKLLPLMSGMAVETEVLEEFTRVRGELEENAYFHGSGAGRPLGVFQATVDGISTGRDITTSSSSGNPTALNLIRTLGSLKPQYRKNSTWLIHRDRLYSIRTLQDGNGNFVWLPAGIGFAQGVTAGLADTILNRPYVESEFSANSTASTTGTGSNSTGYYAIVGDFKRGYRIVDAPGLGVNRYDQINAGTNQDTYIGLWQTDGAPVIEEAFARARLST